VFTTRKENENARSKTILSSKINSTAMQVVFSRKSPKNEDEQYAYDIIQKTYEINEKKIELLDFDKNKKLLEDYYRWLDSRRKG
jgi:hypothetical protein